MIRWTPLWLVVACAHRVADDQPCFEAQVAMAARLEDCTGDTERALELYDQVEVDHTCAFADDPRFEPEGSAVQAGAYECAFAIRNLACELAEAYDQDVDQWLTAAPVCQWLWVAK